MQNEKTKKEIAKRLKKLRLEKGLTMEKTAKQVGAYGSSVVSNWEKGKTTPKPQFMKAYADAFQVPIEWIKYGDFDQYLYNVITNEGLLDPDFTKSAIDFFKRNYIVLDEDLDEYTDVFGFDDYKLAHDICDFFLFGYSFPNICDFVHDGKGEYSAEYEKIMKEIGYNDEVIIFATIDLFKKDLKPLEKMFILQDDIEMDRKQLLQLGLDEKSVNEIYPTVDMKGYYNISCPNILKVENALLKYKKDKKDIPTSITDAIIKLLN